MSDFFEPPLPVEPEPAYVQPRWLGPPSGTLPGVLTIERVLARTEAVAVAVTRFSAYPSGFELDVVTMSADERNGLDPLLFGGVEPGRRADDGQIAPEMLRIGVQFADGAKAMNTGGFATRDSDKAPVGPVMFPRSGGGGGGTWHQSLWIWPLPPPGLMALVCEWPAAGIPLTRYELDAQLILDAAARATVVFASRDTPG
jgi:hypothetical protein